MNSISVENLIQRTEEIAKVVKTEFDLFESYGLQKQIIEQIEKQAFQLKNFGKDEVYKIEIKKTVHEKKVIRAKILNEVRAIKVHLSFRTGEEKNEIDELSKGITLSTDEKMLQAANKIMNRINNWPDTLKSENIILELMRNFSNDLNFYSLAVKNNNNLRKERKQLTERRNKLKSDLYTNLSRISDIGKWIYKDKSKETYLLFVLFPSKNKENV